MKGIGKLLLVIGVICAFIALNMNTTVETGSQFIGDTYISSKKVPNIGKMDDRRNYLMLSALVIIAGVILFAVGSKQTSEKVAESENKRQCPFCAELVKNEAKLCKHCGKDIQIAFKASANQSLTDEIKDSIYRNDIVKIKAILSSGIVLDFDNNESISLLDYAELYDRKEILELLKKYKSSGSVA